MGYKRAIKMKVLHLNTFDANGGAAIACNRLHKALKSEGINSFLGVAKKTTDDESIIPMSSKLNKSLLPFINKINMLPLYLYKYNKNVYFSTDFLSICTIQTIKDISPDIVHLHWVNNSFLSSTAMGKLAQLNIPIVMTLHDTWAFTGGCHYFYNCQNWKLSCGSCSELVYGHPYDITYWNWKAKQKAYAKICPYIVTPSHDFLNRVRASSLLAQYNSTCIPNPIDTSIFRPIERSLARNILGLSQNKKYILFGACSAISDNNKGYDLLCDSLQYLKNSLNIEVTCLIFGASQGASSQKIPFNAQYLGFLHDELMLALVYSAADIFICPSRAENFPNTVLESLSCGTPVIAFSIGGIPDMIDHDITGYIATPHDTKDLAYGIAKFLSSSSNKINICKAARKKVIEQFSLSIIAKQYINVYEKILKINR